MIGLIVEFSASALQLFMLVWLVTRLFDYKYKKYNKSCFMAAWIVVMFETIFINYIAVYDSFLSGMVIITLVIYCQLFFKGKVYIHAFVSFFAMAIIFTVGSITIFSVSYISGVEPEFLMSEFSAWRLIIICVSKLMEFCAFRTIIYINEEYSLSVKEWILFITVAAMTWCVVTFMTKAALLAPEILPFAFYASIIMGMVNVLIYYFLLRLNSDTKSKIELGMLKMQYENVKRTEENMKVFYDNTYSVKHDLEKHFLVIQALADNGDNKEISEYIANVVDDTINVAHKIIFTDNDILNAIINIRLEMCRQKNIFTSIKILEDCVEYIKSEDMTVLIGNIFDNAIDAADKTVEKMIIFTMQKQGGYISICVENSFNTAYSNINLTTSKGNSSEHGFGVRNIKKIVDKYDGMIDFFENEAGMFCCDVLLKIN
ncbi:MAG: GHKL domain-containing protein [Clostridia bacterium]|nr:GHKL domain-containing protein [Clostridia bacterium]